MNNFTFFLSLGLACLTLGSTENSLKKLQVIFRHGYRYPTNLGWTEGSNCTETYKNDHTKLGNLTDLGKSQMSLLGYFLRIHYHSFIDKDPGQVQVNYSDYNRDKESAQLVYKALFDNFADVSGLQVALLNQTMDGRSSTNDTYYVDWLEKLPWKDQSRDQCKDLDLIKGVSCKNRMDYQYILDQMLCEEAEKCQLPDWLKPQIKEKLLAENNDYYGSFNLCINKDFIQENSDAMLEWMIESFKLEKNTQFKKVQLYASHDTNIAIILTRMGIFNSLPVPLGAALIFEEHMLEDQKPIIRIYFDNSTDYSNFHKLKLSDCDWDCPLEKFTKIVTGSYPCSLAARSDAFGIAVTIVISFVLVWASY